MYGRKTTLVQLYNFVNGLEMYDRKTTVVQLYNFVICAPGYRFARSGTHWNPPAAPMTRRDLLPNSLPPRGIARKVAAEYISVSPPKFDQMVADGRMPKPKRIDGRVVWDRRRLDEAFDALPDDGDRNPWDAEAA